MADTQESKFIDPCSIHAKFENLETAKASPHRTTMQLHSNRNCGDAKNLEIRTERFSNNMQRKDQNRRLHLIHASLVSSGEEKPSSSLFSFCGNSNFHVV